jgi:gluconate 2-dehydrogenase gamma chain
VTNDASNRRSFLKNAMAGTAAAVTAAVPVAAEAQQGAPAAATPEPSYSFLNFEEQAFVESLVDHMVPADAHTPRGTDMGLNIFIDRALASGWGNGDRLYMQGPWRQGVPNQGYQLPLTPAQLYRAGIPAANAWCVTTYGKPFDKIGESQRERFLLDWQAGRVQFAEGPPAREFFDMLYENVMQGLFADPIYGGNRDKAGWRMLGFPGIIAVHYQDIDKYRDRRYTANIVGIGDMS